MKRLPLAAAISSVLLAHSATAAISLPPLAANYDLTRTTQYPNGDKPEVGCTPLTGWTQAVVGTGAGEMCEDPPGTATAATISAVGTSSIQNHLYNYQDVGTDEWQIVMRVEDPYTGNLDNLASVGLGVRADDSATAQYYQIFSPYATGFIVQCNSGTSGANNINVDGAPGLSRPRYIALTGFETAANVGDVKGHSSDDGITYTEVCGYTDVPFNNWRGYLFAQSKSATATTGFQIDNLAFDTGPGSITVYTPGPGPDPSAPVLVCPATQLPGCTIPNQTGVLGFEFSLEFRSYFTDETSCTVTGFPGSSGLSETADCIVGGTPTAADVAASPFNLTLSGVNAAGSTPDVVQFSFSNPPPGDTIIWTAGMSNTRTCAQLGAGPGDTIILQGDGNNYRSSLYLSGCQGDEDAPITLKNDVTENTPLRIGSGTDFIFTLDTVEYFIVDGTEKYSGAPDEGCGRYNDADKMAAPAFPRGCGIKIVRENTGGTAVSGDSNSGIKIRGASKFVTIKGVEVDGSDDGIRLGIAGNDHQYPLQGGTQLQCQTDAQDGGGVSRPLCEWHEGWDFFDNYVHDTVAEAMYIGANYAQDGDLDLPVRNVKIRDNIVIDSGYDALSIKSCIDDTGGRCKISGNYVDGAGTAGLGANGNSGACADTWEGGYTDVFDNVLLGCFGPGFQGAIKHRPDSFDPMTITVYNNIIVGASLSNNGNKNGINFVRHGTGQNGTPAEIRPTIYNNTVVESDGGGISVAGAITNCSILNNLLAGTATQTDVVPNNCTAARNEEGTVASFSFSNAGADNYRLTSGSTSVCNDATAGAPATDFEGTVRPQDNEADIGADESASCPSN